MNRLFCFLFLSIFLTNFVFALDCQYTETENYEVFEEGLYNLDGEYMGYPLEFKDFLSGRMNIRGCNRPSFKVYNPNDKDIVLNISYQTSWSNAFGTRSRTHQTTIALNKYSLSDKIEGSCLDIGSGSISPESIKYTIFEPEEIVLRMEKVTKQREICKLCLNEICLNDGAFCNPLYDDEKCGSGICNIAGFCGHQKIVECPLGKLNCQDKICLKPSTKEEGESYMCSFECKSDRFENGICLKSSLVLQQERDERNKNFIIFGVIVLIILSIGVGYLGVYRWRETEKRRKKAEKEIEELLEKIDSLQKEKSDLQSSIKNLNSKIKKGKEKIISLKKDIKNSKGKAKEQLEKNLKYEEQKQKNRLSKLKEEEGKIITLEKDLASKKLKFNKENKEFLIKKALDKYKQRYDDIFYDKKDGYIKFSNNGDFLHRFIYRRKFDKDLRNKAVHHIDADKLNNEDWNLIALPYEEHKRLNHTLIDFRDWASGIKQLKEQLCMKDSDFPQHIQKKIRK